MLLGTTSALATTPPPNPALANYGNEASYTLILIAFGLNLGCLLVGSGLVFAITQCTAGWCMNVSASFYLGRYVLYLCNSNIQTLLSTRRRVFCTMFILSYPFVTLAMAIGINAVGTSYPSVHPISPRELTVDRPKPGMLVAAVLSSSRVILAACVVLTILPTLMMLLFLWTQVSLVVQGWFYNRRNSQFTRDGVSTDGVVTINVSEPDPELARKEKEPGSEYPRMMK